MSELLDKQVNVRKESLKKFQGSRELPQAHEKVCDENERKKKKIQLLHQKKFLEGRKIYKAISEDWLDRFQRTLGYCFFKQ